MLLRRFMEHVKEQNWFAVGLDVLVVIVGIFLGMQVTEWNEERKERESLQQALVKYQEEVQLVINVQNQTLRGRRKLDPYVEDFIEYISTGVNPRNEEINFEFALFNLNSSQLIARNLEAIRQLHDEGLIHRIQSPKLKHLAIAFETQLELSDARMSRVASNYMEHEIDHRDFDFINRAYDSESWNLSRVVVDKEKAKSSNEFRNHVLELWQRRVLDRGMYGQIREYSLNLCHELTKHTGKECDEDAYASPIEDIERYEAMLDKFMQGERLDIVVD